MAIQVGDEAPDFELPSSEVENGRPGKKFRLADFRGKKNVVLAFYPLDFSPVCSGENSCLRDDLPTFDAADAVVFGVSVDSAWTHQAFAQKLGLKYPLLADFNPKGAMAKTYGLYLEEMGITARATVIVDKKGRVAYVKEQPLAEARDDKAIVEALKKLA